MPIKNDCRPVPRAPHRKGRLPTELPFSSPVLSDRSCLPLLTWGSAPCKENRGEARPLGVKRSSNALLSSELSLDALRDREDRVEVLRPAWGQLAAAGTSITDNGVQSSSRASGSRLSCRQRTKARRLREASTVRGQAATPKSATGVRRSTAQCVLVRVQR